MSATEIFYYRFELSKPEHQDSTFINTIINLYLALGEPTRNRACGFPLEESYEIIYTSIFSETS